MTTGCGEMIVNGWYFSDSYEGIPDYQLRTEHQVCSTENVEWKQESSEEILWPN